MFAFLTERDLDFVVRECGGIRVAIDYCDHIAAVEGPLTTVYLDAATRLRIRRDAQLKAGR